MASMELIGGRELSKKLMQLEPKIGRKVIRQSLRVGAKIVAARTKAAAPVGPGRDRLRTKKGVTKYERNPGYLRKAITVRSLTKNKRGTFAVMSTFDTRRFPDLVSVSEGKRYFYPAAVEYGHRASGIFKFGPDVPPHPFIKPAFNAAKGQAAQAVLSSMAKGIIRVATQ